MHNGSMNLLSWVSDQSSNSIVIEKRKNGGQEDGRECKFDFLN